MGLGEGTDSLDAADFEKRIGKSLEENCFGFGADGGFHRCQITRIHRCKGQAVLRKILVDEAIGATVERITNNEVTVVGENREHRCNRCNAAGKRKAGITIF